jgi:hypothetical protein
LPVNYKDIAGVSQVDSIPLYNADIVPLQDAITALSQAGGTVQTVDGIGPDTNKNVQINYVMDSAALQTAIANGTLVPGSNIIVTDEY